MTQYNGPQDPTQWSGQPPQTGGPYPPVPPGPGRTKKNWFARHKILTGIFGLLAVIVIGTAATAGGGSSSDSAGAASDSAGAASAPAATGAAKNSPSMTQPAKTTSEKHTTEASPKKTAGSPRIGTAVKSGDLQFTVTKVVRDKTSVGEDFLAQKAQGRYTLVYVTVRNVGSGSETFLDSDQKIKDADNKTYSPDSTAELAMKNNDVWLSDINPGNAVDGVLVYDMPVGVQATAIEFSGGLFDDAVTVQLR